jgi:hypothetical protein
MTFRLAAASLVIAAGVLSSGVALAQDEWKEEGGGEKLPPDDHGPKKPKEEPPPDADAKPTRLILDIKLGPAFVLSAKGVTDFGLQLNAGYALSHDLVTKGDALFLTVSPYLIVGEAVTLIAPLGVQYDLPLAMIPYKGVSAYARVSGGYAYQTFAKLAFDQGYHGFAVQPALGAKFAFFDRFHVGIEPFAFDVVHTFPPNKKAGVEQTMTAFQLYIFGGAHF